MKRRLHLLIGLVVPMSCAVVAQTTKADSLRLVLKKEQPDTSKIKTLHQLTGALMNNDQDSALMYAHQAYKLSELQKDPYFLGQSIMNIVHAYFVNGHLDSAKSTLINAIPFYKENEKFFWLSASYRNLAVLGEVEELPDTSLLYLDKCIEVLNEPPDSTVLGDVYLSKGFAYRTKGFYELSIEALLNSARIFEVNGNENRKGYVAQNLGLTLYQSGRIKEGLEQNAQSVQYFLKADNIRAAAQSLNNIGIYDYELGDFVDSKSAHFKSIEMSIQTEQNDVLLNNYTNLVNVYVEEGKIDSAKIWNERADQLTNEMSYEPGMSDVALNKSKIALLTDNKITASRFANIAEKYIDSYLDPQYKISAFEKLSSIFERINKPQKSLLYFKQARSLEDSLFTLKQDQQVEELKLIYDTEKKDAQIVLLNKNAELDEIKRKGLWGGLLALTLLANMTIYGLIQRSKKKQAELTKQKLIESKKRQLAEEQLEFKKKELMTKVLQLASKNEFLQKLEEQVNELKSSVDKSVNNTSKKISRMIQQDSLDEDEWKQFSDEFSSVHQNFMDSLHEKYGNFTQSELRLITLLKMNLTTKDIANILRISNEGIKKARYRLRKKMGLESSDDLQAKILGL